MCFDTKIRFFLKFPCVFDLISLFLVFRFKIFSFNKNKNMKYIFLILAIFFTTKIFSQQRTYIKGNIFVLYGQAVKLNQSSEKVFFTMEWELKQKYSPDELQLISDLLKKDFDGAQVIQSPTENTVTFITGKRAFSKAGGFIEYLKEQLLKINLYNGFIKYSESIIELN